MGGNCDWCGRSACKNRRGPTCVRFARMYANEIMIEAVGAEYEPQTPSPLRLAERAAAAIRERNILRGELATARAIIDGTTQAVLSACAERDAEKARADKYEAERDDAIAAQRKAEACIARLDKISELSESGLAVQYSGLLASVFMTTLGNLMIEQGAENFVTMDFVHEVIGPMTVTVRRKDGKSPAEVMNEISAERDALRAELDALKRWYPASEPPDDGRKVLVLIRRYRGMSIETGYWCGRGWHWHDGAGAITHWCELPPGPEVTQ